MPSAQLPCTFSFHNASTIDGLIDKEILATVPNEDHLLKSTRHKTLLNQVISIISVSQMLIYFYARGTEAETIVA